METALDSPADRPKIGRTKDPQRSAITFYFGPTGTPGRFSEGLLLRRLQARSPVSPSLSQSEFAVLTETSSTVGRDGFESEARHAEGRLISGNIRARPSQALRADGRRTPPLDVAEGTTRRLRRVVATLTLPMLQRSRQLRAPRLIAKPL
jgi:hypothetical protein